MIVLVGAITNPWSSVSFKSPTTAIILLYGELRVPRFTVPFPTSVALDDLSIGLL